MKRLLLSVCAASAFFVLGATAQAKDKVKVKKKGNEAAAEPAEHASGAATSEDNRHHKVAALFIEPIGFTFTPVKGIRGEFFLGADNMLDASYVVSGKVGFFDWGYEKTVIDVKFKHFLTNTFYVDGGLGIEQYKVTYDVKQTGSLTTYKTLSGTASNFGGEVHVGNQWQWEGFSLGCDWAGYFFALSKSFSAGSADGVDATDKASQESMLKGIVNAGSAHLVRLYAGWAF